jgi:hypothetical protein
MAMTRILDEGVPSFSFRLEEVEQVVPYDIRKLLGFQKGAPEQCLCIEAHWKIFGV